MKLITINDVLEKKISGKELTEDEIKFTVKSISDKSMEDAQLGAFLAAVIIHDMSNKELQYLTEAMKNSGSVFSWPKDWKVVDKHSTGGVGDKVSLVLAPALAVQGLKVPMISGRGLGHTGGTLDKLESIPGFKVELSEENIFKIVENVGCCIVGQTLNLVPADKRMYYIRDITSTVSSKPLIVSSIISKKASEGLQSLVMDVKFGCGATIKKYEDAKDLAKALVKVGSSLGIETTALMTNMENPLGKTIGNSLEVIEALECLKNSGPEDLRELVIKLGAHLLLNANITTSFTDACDKIKKSLEDKSALNIFQKMMVAQGVNENSANILCNTKDYNLVLPVATFVTSIKAKESGRISNINALTLANVCLQLGAGRQNSHDIINHSVGAKLVKSVGDKINEGESWIDIFHKESDLAKHFRQELESAIKIQNYDKTWSKMPLIDSVITLKDTL